MIGWIYLARWIGHQNWIRFGIRLRAAGRYFRPGLDYGFKTDFFGLTYEGNLNNYIDAMVYFLGAYEREYLLLLRSFLSENPVFIDIGANNGHHSLFMSRFGEVHAFEPLPFLADEIIKKAKANNKPIHVHQIALGEKDETRAFYPPQGYNLGSGSFLKDHSPTNPDSVDLEIRRGDDYILGLNLPNIDAIKIDVEGFEIDVLRGLHKVLEMYRPAVLFEYSATTRQYIDYCDIGTLFPAGYVINGVKCNRPLGPFNRPSCKLTDKPGDYLLAALPTYFK